MLKIALLYECHIHKKLKNKTNNNETHKQQQKSTKVVRKLVLRFTSAKAILATPGSYQARWLR